MWPFNNFLQTFVSEISGNPAIALAVLGTSIIGAFVVSRAFLKATWLFLEVFVIPGINLNRFGAGKGAWAVITGCTDGIGKEFALQLAQKGFNVVLVSRTLAKLEALAEEIHEKYGVETKCVAIDYAKATLEDFERLQEVSDAVEVGVLVNNVGMSVDYPTPFLDCDVSVTKGIVDINVWGTMMTTKVIAPQMVKRRNGLILNTGSMAGVLPTPFNAVYSGSKAFMSFWSQSLGAELSQHNVYMHNLATGFVVSKLSKIRRSNWMAPTAEVYVKHALGKIGVHGAVDDPFNGSTYPGHVLIFGAASMVSKRVALKISYDMHLNMRHKALKKAERDAKTE